MEKSHTTLDSIRNFTTAVGPWLQLLFAVIAFYYVRDMEKTSKTINDMSEKVTATQELVTKQSMDMNYMMSRISAGETERKELRSQIDELKDVNAKQEIEIVKLQMKR